MLLRNCCCCCWGGGDGDKIGKIFAELLVRILF